MANSYEHETESDDDCEVYFLKPVNEYNIVDKIKEANKELFAQEDDDATTDNDDQNVELMALAASRKVSFAANLEVYEPQSGISLQELENKLGKEEDGQDIEGSDKEENSTENDNPPPKLEVINEEDPSNDDPEIDTHSSPVRAETHLNCLDPEGDTEIMASPETDDIEEICEEILIMDMETDNKTVVDNSLPKMRSCESPATMQRKMLKQITFDYDEDEQDNKSLTNLLISDNENEEDEDEEDEDEDEDIDNCIIDADDVIDYNCNESLLEDSDNEEKLTQCEAINQSEEFYNNNNADDEEEEDDEDDKLSIIVDSYLPDDNFDCDKASLTSDNKCRHHQSFRSRSRLPFNNRFSFKSKSKHSNVVGSSCSNNSNRRFLPPPEVTDLKLHYKTCCEFKNAQQKLPKYTGYLSEYGLSRDQLEEREHKLQHKQRSLLQQTLRTSEDEMRKMHDNERAFTTWLKNKMRFPINKTRNMFDVKRPFGIRKCTSVSGTALSQDSAEGDNNNHLIPHTTRYRSISAKFKKK